VNDFDNTVTFDVTNSAGIRFTVRIVRSGDRYGAFDEDAYDFVLVHGEPSRHTTPGKLDVEPMIEFYDTRYPFTPFGQFVTRYYASTLAERADEYVSLMLDGGSSDWFIDGAGLQRVLGAALTVTTHPGD